MFLPIAYVAGVHGFVFFAPYLALVLATLHFARRRRVALAARAAFEPGPSTPDLPVTLVAAVPVRVSA